MLELIQEVLASRSPWSSVFFLIVGAFLGALIGVYLAVRAQRPRLIITGRSGSSVYIKNAPTFFGARFAGETARDLHASIRQKDRPQFVYPVAWSGERHGHKITLEAGQSHSVDLFSWSDDRRGAYYVPDQKGEPAALFDAPELAFILKINDRLGRETKLKFWVKFDASHLKKPPQILILFPIPWWHRVLLIKRAFQQLFDAITRARG